MPSKKDLDKSKMFQKIMPSSAAAQAADAAKNETLENTQEAPTPQDASSSASGGGTLNPDQIAALFAAQQTDDAPEAAAPAEAPAPEAPAAITEEPQAVEPAPAVAPASSGGTLNPDQIAALFAAQQTDDAPEAAAPAEAPAPEAPAALAEEPQSVEPAPAAAPTSSGGTLNPDQIAALFAAQQTDDAPEAAAPAEAPAPETPAAITAEPQTVEPAPDAAPTSNSGTLTPNQIAAFFADQHNKNAEEAQAAQTQAETIEAETHTVDISTDVPLNTPEPAAEPPTASEALPPPSKDTVTPIEDLPAFASDAHPINLPHLHIDQNYETYRKRLNACNCERCRDDVFGIALNRIRPRYISSDQLDPSMLKNRELVTETVTALIQALFIVKRNPHHD